ncbi:MAG: PhzF family phenazine biosynthesis protein [Bacteroidetes bacterium]|nr:PhzF family phenazine biosynthesis protein [Bacteroidota bacterium]MBU2505244.1 PhzF family phenazine biosynthesis protein [Bacteroidota bacterium]
MKFKIYQVDAFTKELFRGNPAAVIPLESWLDYDTMQKIALENNLSETAFFVKEEKHYHIRWFTPAIEVPLCGHATLASSFVIFNYIEPQLNEIRFQSKSGELIITREGELISLNFPANVPAVIEPPDELLKLLPIKPLEVLFNQSFVAVFNSEDEIRTMKPDLKALAEIDADGLIITAPGNEVDFVSRYFVPSAGIDEDPVTGYAHTLLTPYWSNRLNKTELHALQVSKRSGELFLKNLENNRVLISGAAVLYMIGELFISENHDIKLL